jgi:hypothetical protein
MKNMTDMAHRNHALSFLKAGDSIITITSGKEYKLSQALAIEFADVFFNTGWISTNDFMINEGSIAALDRDGSGNKETTEIPSLSGKKK